MSKLLLVAALLTLASSGCGRALTYRLADATTPKQAATVREAVELWNEKLPDDSPLVIAPGGDWEVEFVDEGVILPDDDAITCDAEGTEIRGWKCPHSGWIGVRKHVFRYEDEWLPRSTVAHELGHSMGLDHVKDAHSVMSETVASATLTAADVEECRDDGPCK